MSRWARRMPDTLRARIQFEDWMLRLRSPSYTYTQIARVARMVELFKPDDQSLYTYLRRLDPSLVDLNNPVLHELARRRIARDAAIAGAGRPATHRLELDGSLTEIVR